MHFYRYSGLLSNYQKGFVKKMHKKRQCMKINSKMVYVNGLFQCVSALLFQILLKNLFYAISFSVLTPFSNKSEYANAAD